MEQSLLAQCAKAKQTPATIERLILDHCAASRLQDLAQCKNLVSLSIFNAGLHSLEGFPSLMRLRTLELSDNRIVGNGLEALANAGLPSITKLNLSGNRLATLDNLRPLAKLTTLRNLDLFNCPVTNQPGYRQMVQEMLPMLVYLDGTNREGEEDEGEDDDEDEEDEEDEDEGEEEPAPGAAAAPKKRKATDEEESSEEDDDDDDEEEDANAKAKKQQGGMRMPPKRSAPVKAAESGSDEEDESSSEEGAPAQAPAAAAEEEEESSEDEDDDDEAEAGAKRRKADEEEEEEESSSEEER